MKKLFTVCGMPRSGTTALARWLARQTPSIYLPELHFPLMHREGYNVEKLPDITSEKNSLIRLYTENQPTTLSAALLKFIKLKNVENNPFLVVESTPANIELLPQKELRANVSFIVIVRRPSDVVNSILQQPWGSNRFERILYRWIRYLILTIRFQKKAIVIDYEYFCSQNFEDHKSEYAAQIIDLSGKETSETWKAGSSGSSVGFKTNRKRTLTNYQRIICWLVDFIFYFCIFKVVFCSQSKQLEKIHDAVSNCQSN